MFNRFVLIRSKSIPETVEDGEVVYQGSQNYYFDSVSHSEAVYYKLFIYFQETASDPILTVLSRKLFLFADENVYYGNKDSYEKAARIDMDLIMKRCFSDKSKVSKPNRDWIEVIKFNEILNKIFVELNSNQGYDFVCDVKHMNDDTVDLTNTFLKMIKTSSQYSEE